jgi:hypothetical protein
MLRVAVPVWRIHIPKQNVVSRSVVKTHFALILFVGFATLPAVAQKSPAPDSGMFLIMSSQKRVGTEKFRISNTANGTEVTGEIEVNMPGSPKVTETCLLKLDSKNYPISYARQQVAPKKGTIAVLFDPSETKVTASTDAGTEDRLFLLPADHLAVLDTNFFHQYALLLRLYDATQGGPQHFNVFVPQEATPGTISLELQGKESLQVGKTARELNHYQAITDEIKIDIWATPQGEIYRMTIPQANVEVVRQ